MNPLRKLIALLRPQPTAEDAEARAAERLADLSRAEQDVDRAEAANRSMRNVGGWG